MDRAENVFSIMNIYSYAHIHSLYKYENGTLGGEMNQIKVFYPIRMKFTEWSRSHDSWLCILSIKPT